MTIKNEPPLSCLLSIAKQLENKELNHVQNDLIECAVHILTNVMFQVSGKISVDAEPIEFEIGEPCEVLIAAYEDTPAHWQRTTIINKIDCSSGHTEYQTAMTGRHDWICEVDRLRKVPKS